MMMTYLLITTLLLSVVYSRPEFQTKIPNGDNVFHLGELWPGVGHLARQGAGQRNLFGLAFAKAGYEWTQGLCEADSDGDGVSNGEELGDPDCVWVEGEIPTRVVDITHPGFAPDDGLNDPDCDLPVVNEQSMVLTFDEYHVSEETTTYICAGFDLPDDELYFAVKFKPVITSTAVHHMLVYACTESQDPEPSSCSDMKAGCDAVFFAWALGGSDFCLPENVGLTFGRGDIKHVILEVHFDNPSNLDNIVDSSGVEVIYTNEVQDNIAGFVQLGRDTGTIKIPPGETDYELTGTCGSDSTSLLQSDIYVIANLLHMHQIGKQIWTSLIRDDVFAYDLGRNENYDFNLQTFVKHNPPLAIQSGDILETHCVYNSAGRDKTTRGGEASTDEMCLNYILVVPKIEASCLSASSTLIFSLTSLLIIALLY